MPTARRAFAALFRRQYFRALLGACVVWLASGPLDVALARTAYGDFKTAAALGLVSNQGRSPDVTKLSLMNTISIISILWNRLCSR